MAVPPELTLTLPPAADPMTPWLASVPALTSTVAPPVRETLNTVNLPAPVLVNVPLPETGPLRLITPPAGTSKPPPAVVTLTGRELVRLDTGPRVPSLRSTAGNCRVAEQKLESSA